MPDQGTPPLPPAGNYPPPQSWQSPPPAGAPGPQPGAEPQPGVTPQVAVPPVAVGVPAAAAPGAVPRRRSRAWIWWTIGIVVALTLIIASCALPIFWLAEDEGAITGLGYSDSIAVIRVDGIIAGTGDTYSGYVTPESFYDQLEPAEDDEFVKAIVLRVDSPGGTVAASEEIAEYVKTCKKPVIVSIGDVGASGAYMIASQSDEIWAMPGSSVGSIGVIAEIPNVQGLLDKVGVEFQTITAGKYKDAGSPYRPLTKEERALIQGEVEEAYDQFIDIVADGRDMDRAKVEKLATGWTWSGERAIELGLIDKVGTYQQALDAAAERGGIEGEYEIVTYEEEFGDLFGSLLSLTRQLDDLKAVTTRESAVRSSLPR